MVPKAVAAESKRDGCHTCRRRLAPGGAGPPRCYGVPQRWLRTVLGARPLTETTAGTGAYEPVGLRQAFTSTVAQTWADIAPPEHGTVEDLLEAVDPRILPATGQGLQTERSEG